MLDYTYYNPTLSADGDSTELTTVQAAIPQTTLQTTILGGYDRSTDHEPWFVDPITGFRAIITRAQWNGSAWVDGIAYDEPYYREPKRVPPILHPLMIRPRRKGAGGIFER